MKRIQHIAAMVIFAFGLSNCHKANYIPGNVLPEVPLEEVVDEYPGIPQSVIYEVTIIKGGEKQKMTVFQNSCPEFQLGYMDMAVNDQYPLNIFKGRSINWTKFSLDGGVTVEVKVLDKTKVPVGGTVKVLPSRYGITPVVEGDIIRFTISNPGQCSVEIGENGYKNGLMIFADPPETDIPDTSAASGFTVLTNASSPVVKALPASVTGIYFKKGIHDIGVFKLPSNIKSVYLAPGAWVYGALIMDGNPGVKIYGRGVLSSARLKYRESHAIEAINGSDNVHLEGIVLADGKYFTVRLIGKNNIVSWIKVIGGWTYNLDGISAFAGSTVSHCFVWANDDNIKVYRNNITFSDMVLWQLNNGGCIQLSWGGGNAKNVTISRVDILHAEWNNDEVNRGVISCVGDKFEEGNKNGLQQNFLIQDLITETPVPLIFRISPNPASPNPIHGMVFKNWNVQMDMSKGFSNYIKGGDAADKFDGIVFDNFLFNGTKLTKANWLSLGNFQVTNIEDPEFK